MGLGADVLEGHGNFSIDNDPYYTAIGTGWTIGSGVAAFNAGTAANITKAGVLTLGKKYLIEYSVVARAAGSTRVLMGSSGFSVFVSAVKPYHREYVTCSGSTTVIIQATAGANLSIDNLVVREVFGDWKNNEYATKNRDISPRKSLSRYWAGKGLIHAFPLAVNEKDEVGNGSIEVQRFSDNSAYFEELNIGDIFEKYNNAKTIVLFAKDNDGFGYDIKTYRQGSEDVLVDSYVRELLIFKEVIHDYDIEDYNSWARGTNRMAY